MRTYLPTEPIFPKEKARKYFVEYFVKYVFSQLANVLLSRKGKYIFAKYNIERFRPDPIWQKMSSFFRCISALALQLTSENR